MRGAAVGALIVGLLIGAWGLLWPFGGQVLGTTYSCGMPWVGWVREVPPIEPPSGGTFGNPGSSVDHDLALDCNRRARVRTIVGAVFGVGLVLASIVLLAVKPAVGPQPAGPPPPSPPPGPPPVPGASWDGYRWLWWDGQSWRT